MATALNHKALGAFYTPGGVAKALAAWAIRHKSDSVLDPSCGKGVFLAAALDRLTALGGTTNHVCGIDFDPRAVGMARSSFPSCDIVRSNFFHLQPQLFGQFAAVVGNPPFIRYQNFSGKEREVALRCATQVGVELPQLTSSWAPFIVHATGFIRRGGRLAMVVPAELDHAQYALGVLRFLTREFADIKICMFRRKLFPDLSEDTILLLASDRGASCRRLSVAAFDSIDSADLDTDEVQTVDIDSVRAGRTRLRRYLLPRRARRLYESFTQTSGVVRLGEAADVGIGYVTGCNDFFHLSTQERARMGIPREHTRPATTSLANHRGLLFTHADWVRRQREGEKTFLLTPPAISEEALPPQIRNYLAYGRSTGVHTRFKCRVRQPWFSVPNIRTGDALLSYMAGGFPRLVLNPKNLVAPNTLHIVRFIRGHLAEAFVAGWHSSLTQLSCEIEGHALGGGMLKLEPSEAESVLVALPHRRDATSIISAVDQLLRNDEAEAARDLVDAKILGGHLGLSAADRACLHDAAAWAERWRLHR